MGADIYDWERVHGKGSYAAMADAQDQPSRERLEQRLARLEADVKRILLHLNLEPAFLQDRHIAGFRGGSTAVRLTHQPTGIQVDAPTKAEAAALLAGELEVLSEEKGR